MALLTLFILYRPNWLYSSTNVTILGRSGWVNQIDVKLAKPRNSTSPNYQAFSSKTEEEGNTKKTTNTNSSRKNSSHDCPDGEGEDFSGILFPDKDLLKVEEGQQKTNFSISNTFVNREKSYTGINDKINPFVNTYSEKVISNGDHERLIKEFKKRFSLDVNPHFCKEGETCRCFMGFGK